MHADQPEMPANPPATPKPKLRWYQFSLRTLLIFVTLFAFACSWFAVKMGQAKKQKEAVDAIVKLGGQVEYDNREYSTGPPMAGKKTLGSSWLRKLLGDDFLSNVTFIYLRGEKVTNTELEHLDGLEHVLILSLNQSPITDAGLVHLEGLKQLGYLDLWETQITDTGLKHLDGLKQLRYLSLRKTRVTDAGLEHLEGFKQLHTLNIAQTQVTYAGVAKLKIKLPNLQIQR